MLPIICICFGHETKKKRIQLHATEQNAKTNKKKNNSETNQTEFRFKNEFY